MNCQNCDAPVLASDELCAKCGAKLLHRRIFLGSPKAEEFSLTEDEPENEPAEAAPEEFSRRTEVEPAAQPIAIERPAARAFRYGGFWRRLSAFLIDLVMIAVLCAVMAIMSYIGYKVGLAGHDRRISFTNAVPLVAFLSFAGALLATAYFVIFHGMSGQTIGKAMLHLRVTGAAQQPITYSRALLRWIGTLACGLLSLGLSILWIVWSREKRAWHDFLAHTWVVRE